ncbi:MAG: adenylate/guanylate cyclase domain-containing protein [SAR202 cluster bacterium]|nr:adenylate/guanylate cyclase domain-containing protein [SAR202 cluster bacterium]MDP6713502.1 adenylate/guanylate cyclase domain-containing protein [SAR202 cluster bacterium]
MDATVSFPEKSVLQNVLGRVEQSAERLSRSHADPQELRLQKNILMAAAVMMSMGGIVWGVICAVFSEPWASLIPFSYTSITLVNIIAFRLFNWFGIFRFIQILISLMLPFALMAALGGFLNSGAVVFWSLVAPLGAVLVTDRRGAIYWFLAFVGVVIIGGIMEPFGREGNDLPYAVITIFFVMNVLAPASLAIIVLQYFVRQKDTAMSLLQQEQEKSERLLLNVLPAGIAEILKDDTQTSTIADNFEAVSVLFADVVGSTPLTVELTPKSMVELLNDVFSHFDTLVEKYGLEKIRTIGDNYMVASGVPEPREDHAIALAGMAVEMNEYLHHRPSTSHTHLEFRIGMNSGPVVGGVIGNTKFHYDIWGDAVNTASRMESHGLPGKIQITKETYELLRDDFICAERGLVDVKGKGMMETWFLEDFRR